MSHETVGNKRRGGKKKKISDFLNMTERGLQESTEKAL